MFGGVGIEKDYNDVLVIPFSHVLNDSNFSEINEIM
jgi:hypothetical protein